jgi:hypothetical protein
VADILDLATVLEGRPGPEVGKDQVADSAAQALAPSGESTVVFRDNAFADDVAKTNLTAILDQQGISNVRSL